MSTPRACLSKDMRVVVDEVIDNAIAHKMLRTLPPIYWTRDQVVEAFIPKEHQHTMREAARLAFSSVPSAKTLTHVMNISPNYPLAVSLTVADNNREDSTFFPDQGGIVSFDSDHYRELAQRAEDQYDLDYRVAKLRGLVEFLTYSCNLNQLKMVWPDFTALLTLAHGHDKVVNAFSGRFNKVNPGEVIPYLFPGFDAALDDARSLVGISCLAEPAEDPTMAARKWAPIRLTFRLGKVPSDNRLRLPWADSILGWMPIDRTCRWSF